MILFIMLNYYFRKVTQDLLMSQPSQPIRAENSVEMLTEDEDDVYFGSYAHFSIHQEMLKVCKKDDLIEIQVHVCSHCLKSV